MDLFTINITSELIYNGFDLNGEEIEMVDVFPRDYSGFHFDDHTVLSMEKLSDKLTDNLVHSESSQSTSGRSELIEIDLPIYERTIQQQVQGNDLSINSCILSLFAVIEAIGDVRRCEITDSVYDAIKHKVIKCPNYDLSRDFSKKLLRNLRHGVFSKQLDWTKNCIIHWPLNLQHSQSIIQIILIFEQYF